MKNGALIVLEPLLVAHDLVVDPKYPRRNGVEDEHVGENWRDVAVPDSLEVEVEGKLVDFERIFEVCRNNCQQRGIIGRLEPINIRVDENRYKNSVKNKEQRIDNSLRHQPRRIRLRPGKVNNLINKNTKQRISNSGRSDNSILNTLGDKELIHLVLAVVVQLFIVEGSEYIFVAVAYLLDGGACDCGELDALFGDVDAFTVRGVGVDVDTAEGDDGCADENEHQDD